MFGVLKNKTLFSVCQNAFVLKFVSHKLRRSRQVERSKKIRATLMVSVHRDLTTTVENIMSQRVIGSDRLRGSLRGLMDHAGSADEVL